ncbi:hypothetical protein RUND412_000826 [Rhizina undulata]
MVFISFGSTAVWTTPRKYLSHWCDFISIVGMCWKKAISVDEILQLRQHCEIWVKHYEELYYKNSLAAVNRRTGWRTGLFDLVTSKAMDKLVKPSFTEKPAKSLSSIQGNIPGEAVAMHDHFLLKYSRRSNLKIGLRKIPRRKPQILEDAKYAQDSF